MKEYSKEEFQKIVINNAQALAAEMGYKKVEDSAEAFYQINIDVITLDRPTGDNFTVYQNRLGKFYTYIGKSLNQGNYNLMIGQNEKWYRHIPVNNEWIGPLDLLTMLCNVSAAKLVTTFMSLLPGDISVLLNERLKEADLYSEINAYLLNTDEEEYENKGIEKKLENYGFFKEISAFFGLDYNTGKRVKDYIKEWDDVDNLTSEGKFNYKILLKIGAILTRMLGFNDIDSIFPVVDSDIMVYKVSTL